MELLNTYKRGWLRMLRMTVRPLFLLSILLLPTLSFGFDLKLGTYNIRNFDSDPGVSQKTNHTSLARVIRGLNADVIAIQEIVNHKEFQKFVRRYFPDYGLALTNCGGFGKQKLGFLYNANKIGLTDFKEDSSLSEGKGCDLGLRPAAIGKFRVKRNGFTFSAVAVHLKAGGTQRSVRTRLKQYKVIQRIVKKIETSGQSKVVVMGDFNTTDYVLRNANYQKFLRFTESANLVDFSRSLDCTSYWWGGVDDGFEYSSILDHIMVSQSFYSSFRSKRASNHAHCKRVQCKDVTADTLGETFEEVSDHCPVTVNLR